MAGSALMLVSPTAKTTLLQIVHHRNDPVAPSKTFEQGLGTARIIVRYLLGAALFVAMFTLVGGLGYLRHPNTFGKALVISAIIASGYLLLMLASAGKSALLYVLTLP